MSSSASNSSASVLSALTQSTDVGPLWEYVTKISKAAETGGTWKFKCKFCLEVKHGSYSRVKAHLLQQSRKGISVCKKIDHSNLVEIRTKDDEYEKIKTNSAPRDVPLPSGGLQYQNTAKKRKSNLSIFAKAFDVDTRDQLDVDEIDDVEEPPTLKQKQDHVDTLMNEDIDDRRHHVEQDPLTSTQKCSSPSSTQNKKQKLQLSDDIFSGFGKDISKFVSMTLEKTIEDGLGPCYKRLGTLEEGVSKITRMMMEKNKEVDVGFNKLETLEKDVSKFKKMMMEKNKEDDVGACFKKLKSLEKDVSKLTRITMDKNKEDDVGACYKKLETLEEDVSRMTRMIMEKNNEDVVGFNKLEILEEDVSKMKKMKIEKNKEDDEGACFKKLETLEEDVSKLTRMMMENRKEDDMGACIEKLDKMGWGAEEPIYDTALLLFLKGADYRKLWLHLKPERCGKWLKVAGSIFGLLD